MPFAALVIPQSSALHLSAYAMTLTGKFMCYAIAALALGLVWGYRGILSLGHALFFALGGYAIGMYLMRTIGRALTSEPQLLILDEQTERSQPSIIQDIGRTLRQLVDEMGMTVVLVEQYYDFAKRSPTVIG